jgi:RimJ/RimL family protein N-acetyltransferase
MGRSSQVWSTGRVEEVVTAALMLRAYTERDVPQRRLELFHAVENTGSCRVANAARFRLEGTLRQSHRYSDGVWHDEHLHARLRSD